MINSTKILLLIVILGVHGMFAQNKPMVSFTFDDGMLANRPGYQFEEWNALLLQKLKNAGITAAFFVKGAGKDNHKGLQLIKSWNDNGHIIANHTWNHPNYNNPDITVANFQQEIMRTDTLINTFGNYQRLFRFPYLKEGNTQKKVDEIRNFLDAIGYKKGYVSIDASDWYIDSRLVKKLSKDPDMDINKFREFYLDHIWDRALFYEKMACEMEGRHIKHNLLLHHNLISALFIDDLIAMFKEKGWQVISANEAFKDLVYSKEPKFAGESIIYALAKDTGKYDDQLRYPAEDSRYLKEEMDTKGL